MRRGNRRVEQGAGFPHFIDVVRAQHRVLEEVRDLLIDVERIVAIEQINVEQVVTVLIVLQTIQDDYTSTSMLRQVTE